MNATIWPKRSREGHKLAISSYCENIIRILEDSGERQFIPSLHVWKKILALAMYTAKVESDTNWSLVHRCCRALISHRDMSEENIDDRLLSIGLDAAQKVKDPKLAADLICSTRAGSIFQYDEIDAGGNPSSKSSMSRVSPSTYFKAIKLCVDNKKPCEGNRILIHCLKNDLPSKVLGDMHTLVLTGYARNGDVKQAKALFDGMQMAQIPVT